MTRSSSSTETSQVRAKTYSFELAEHHEVDPERAVHFWGNFYRVSHGFSIWTDDEDVIRRLVEAIKANKDTNAYADARAELREEAARKAQRGTPWGRRP